MRVCVCVQAKVNGQCQDSPSIATYLIFYYFFKSLLWKKYLVFVYVGYMYRHVLLVMHDTYMVVREQSGPAVTFYLSGERSRVPMGAWGLQLCASPHSFTWVLGIHTQFLKLAWQALYLLFNPTLPDPPSYLWKHFPSTPPQYCHYRGILSHLGCLFGVCEGVWGYVYV